MRALCVRFKDCEGPGIIESVLRENGYRVSFHNAYDLRVQLLPEAHLNFNLIVLLGGPQSVTDPDLDSFFQPYYMLVKNMMANHGRKLIGICLGSQIIAKALGAEVFVGDKGPEVGFSPMKIRDVTHPIFKGINQPEIQAFHLHEDTFSIPKGATHLLESDLYKNQMFAVENKVFAFQAHIEPTLPMLEVWKNVHKDFIAQGNGDFKNLAEKQKEMETSARIIFRNILYT
ncbi:type 1 glutamine amidotransferase [Leptospira ognonensis]|uniref:Type 1 glutamine amidotransferase n=1 Tax=Leptospira ognonensis TaxID=2484945 RepID=A0A4R9K4A6_9LEPT|nr:type 1 glutamine amidotransferase [Leptospira ognonensis]TGL60060.1 type 1 glutamine amidotransferase [Leptospira ognonensis]